MRRSERRGPGFAVLAAVVGLAVATALGAAGTPASVADELAVGVPARIDVPVPAPGGTSRFHVTTRSVDALAELRVRVDDVDPPAAVAHALDVRVHDHHGREIARGVPGDLPGVTVSIGAVGPEPVTLFGTVALPAEVRPADAHGSVLLDLRVLGPPAADAPRTRGVPPVPQHGPGATRVAGTAVRAVRSRPCRPPAAGGRPSAS